MPLVAMSKASSEMNLEESPSIKRFGFWEFASWWVMPEPSWVQPLETEDHLVRTLQNDHGLGLFPMPAFVCQN